MKTSVSWLGNSDSHNDGQSQGVLEKGQQGTVNLGATEKQPATVLVVDDSPRMRQSVRDLRVLRCRATTRRC